MIPEVGQLALAFALCLALVQGVLPIVGAATGRTAWMALARPAAAGQFVFLALAIGVLTYAFLNDDFSVKYVWSHSNTVLPVFYKVTAVWGGHEGSMLLWTLVLAAWTLGVAASSGGRPLELSSRVLAVLGLCNAGFIAFTAFTSNPFERLPLAPFDGNDLNPLLQDFGMIIHPPTLYWGYVGMAVPFAFAVAALVRGKLDQEWARWMRPWTIMPWALLTLGIAFGSWWAYYEVGWGGWWFWDPVENASFLPWLAATALLHSLAVTERRGLFKNWTVLLAIAAFSLSVLGTFLTRSDVITSVHSFANDPTRGLFLLGLLALISGGALTLFAMRASSLESPGGFKALSRETFLLANNILLVVALGFILLGTLYPLFLFLLKLPPASVGAATYDLIFPLLMLPLAAFVGVGMHAAWKRAEGARLRERLRWPALIALVGGIAVPLVVFGGNSVMTIVGAVVGIWVVATALFDPVRRYLLRSGTPLSRAHWGMCLAHLGVGVFILGATIVNSYDVEVEYAARPGDTRRTGNYEVQFRAVREVRGANYTAQEGEFELRDASGETIAVLRPQLRHYPVREVEMSEAGIDRRLSRDVFVGLHADLGEGAWAVRVRVKPLVHFVWIGAVIMALGGLLAATDRRYRRVPAPEPALGPSAAPAVARSA